MTPDDVAEWLRRDDGRIEDIFGLWVQGKRDGRWVGERLIEEGHLAALRAAQPEDDGLDVERLAEAINNVTEPADPSESTLAWDLDFGREWYGTPRELATEIAAALRESSEGVERREPQRVALDEIDIHDA